MFFICFCLQCWPTHTTNKSPPFSNGFGTVFSIRKHSSMKESVRSVTSVGCRTWTHAAFREYSTFSQCHVAVNRLGKIWLQTYMLWAKGVQVAGLSTRQPWMIVTTITMKGSPGNTRQARQAEQSKARQYKERQRGSEQLSAGWINSIGRDNRGYQQLLTVTLFLIP